MKKIILVCSSLFLCTLISAQSITVTTPNGGEQWVVGNKHPIHWDWSDGITSVRLEYSTDGGANWMLIASSTQNDGDYLWTIPNTISMSCFVKISDVANPSTNDLSDGSFSIVRPSIDVKRPDGGEILRIGEYCPIHWDWTGQFNTVKLEYSTDGGSSWNSVIANTQNDGDHYWLVPNAPSSACRVKITHLSDPDCFSISDSNFTITNNTVTVITPNGGEAYTTGQIYPIYWDWTGSFSSVKIEYSTDGGGTWNNVVTSTQNDGSHYWTIPDDPSNNCRIKITNTTDPTCFDMSDDNFAILSSGLQILCPDGGESYVVGDVCPIHWDWAGTISSVKLEYSTNGGSTWNIIISSTTNDGDYVWTLPNIPSTQCRVKITNLADPNCWDESAANFTIVTPSFTIFDPDSAKSLVAGETYPIHWNWQGTVSNVKLELWYKGATGVEWWTITASTQNDGSHYFTMPYYISDSAGIKLTSNDDANCYDLSEVFRIVRPTIDVIYPNGGESLIEGEKMEIIWDWNGNFTNVMLQYSIDEGSNWQTITNNTTNDGSYTWNVPSGVWPTCLVKVINTADIDCYDVSDVSFNIHPDTITVIRPAFGDTFFVQHKHPIYWKWVGSFPTAQIRYSTDGGSSWNTITASATNTGRYLWTCNADSSINARIAVISNLNLGTFDVSDNFIVADTSSLTDSLRVLAPIVNDTFAIGGKCYITWHSVNFLSPNQVNLWYSIDGPPWINIGTVVNTQRSYEWTIPNYVTDNCQILVEDVNGTASDMSDNFSIVLQKIKILSPTSVKEWIVGRKYYILWKWTGNFANAVIDYSYNGGVDWVNIVSPTQNDGEYEWMIPNAPSTQCLIRIRNFENANVVAISDTFTIKPQEIKMNYPIASDSFIVGRKYYVTWDYTGAFSSVNIEYSIDGGSNWIPVASSVTNNQYYEWTIPNTPTDLTVVRVINSANTDVFGTSDTFSIIPQTIEVTSPVLYDQWIVGRKYYITWRHTGAFTNVKIQYSYDNGGSWNTVIESATNSRSYEWTIPNTPSDSCLVKVSNYHNLAVYDESEQFRIPLQTIETTSPVSGDRLISNRKYYITWKWTGSFSNVDIELSTDNGQNWSYIANNVTNNGNYQWTTPTTNSESCFVRLSNPQNPNVYDISDIFAILPQEITITSPGSSDTLIAGRKYYLTWRVKGSFTNADLWYSLDAGQNWVVIATNVNNNGYYEWPLPEAPSTLARIKIANSAQPSVYAESDTFVLSPPILEITSPVLGNLWWSTRKYYITWNCLGGIQQVNLFYSTDGGGDWNQIVANQQNQGNYEWTIPEAIASPHCRVRLVSSANAEIAYMSDSFLIGILGIEEEYPFSQLPKEFALQGFLPNPFVNNGEIRLAIPAYSTINLRAYDVCGRFVSEIFAGNIEPGFHSFTFDGKNNHNQMLPRGVYFLKFEAQVKGEKIYDRTIKILKM